MILAEPFSIYGPMVIWRGSSLHSRKGDMNERKATL